MTERPEAGDSSRRQRARRLRCCFLTISVDNWFNDLILLAPGLEFAVIDGTPIGVRTLPNPYRLPVEERFDAALISSEWYKWLSAQGSRRARKVVDQLRSHAATVIAVDGCDRFGLAVPPDCIERVDMVLKSQGLYRDRDLYNYRVGPFFPGVTWTEKRDRRSAVYTDSQLDKLRLSLPCFVHAIPSLRRAVRNSKPDIARPLRWMRHAGDAVFNRIWQLRLGTHDTRAAHFVGALTHLQRLDLLLMLEEMGCSGRWGITRVPDLFLGSRLVIGGADVYSAEDLEESQVRTAGPDEVDSFRAAIFTIAGELIGVDPDERQRVVRMLEARGLRTAATSRWTFWRSLAKHALVIAPTGYGELTFRHGEALMVGRTLLCQDLRHVETMFPFRDRKNVVFCRPDLRDVPALLRELTADPELCETIAVAGRRAWRSWTQSPDVLLWNGVTRHIIDAVAA